jgi:hypothetical protein
MRINGDTNILGNITSSANISASGNLQGVNFHAFNTITRVGVSAGQYNTGNQTVVGNQAGYTTPATTKQQ